MSRLIGIKVDMDDYDERSIPRVVTLTFTNGDICSYVKSGIEQANPIGRNNKLANFTPRRYDLRNQKMGEKTFEAIFKNCEAKLAALDRHYKSNFEEAEQLYTEEIENIRALYDANEQLWGRLSKGMYREYYNFKKQIYSRIEALKVPEERLRTMVQWLRDTKVGGLLNAAEMLESEASYITQRIHSPQMKHDIFLSYYAQRHSTDATRNIKESLEKKGINIWFDKSVKRLDKHGIIDGIVDSRLFTIFLTREYFKRPHCLFEYCIAAVLGKKVITVYEPKPSHGGGPIKSFKLPELFKHIMNHELLELSRTYWEYFITILHLRIKKTAKPVSWMVPVKERFASVKERFATNSNRSVMTGLQRAWLQLELAKEGWVLGRRLFSTSVDGNTAEAFHKKCDDQGETVTLVKSSNGHVFGGFSSVPWSTNEGYKNCADSVWLFKYHDDGQGERIDIQPKFRQYAVRHSRTSGPCFGYNDLAINVEKSRTKNWCQKMSFNKGILSDHGAIPFEVSNYEVFRVYYDFSPPAFLINFLKDIRLQDVFKF